MDQNRKTLQSVPDPWTDWRTQSHWDEEVLRAREKLNELLIAIDALEQEIQKGHREHLFPPHILMYLMAGIYHPQHTLLEILKRFRTFLEDELVLVRKEALAILRDKGLIVEPSITELRAVFARLAENAELPEVHRNNISPGPAKTNRKMAALKVAA